MQLPDPLPLRYHPDGRTDRQLHDFHVLHYSQSLQYVSYNNAHIISYSGALSLRAYPPVVYFSGKQVSLYVDIRSALFNVPLLPIISAGWQAEFQLSLVSGYLLPFLLYIFLLVLLTDLLLLINLIFRIIAPVRLKGRSFAGTGFFFQLLHSLLIVTGGDN